MRIRLRIPSLRRVLSRLKSAGNDPRLLFLHLRLERVIPTPSQCPLVRLTHPLDIPNFLFRTFTLGGYQSMVQHLYIRKGQERRDVIVGHIRVGCQTDQRPWCDETCSRAPHSWLHRGLADSLGRISTDELAKMSHAFVKVTCSVTFLLLADDLPPRNRSTYKANVRIIAVWALSINRGLSGRLQSCFDCSMTCHLSQSSSAN